MVKDQPTMLLYFSFRIPAIKANRRNAEKEIFGVFGSSINSFNCSRVQTYHWEKGVFTGRNVFYSLFFLKLCLVALFELQLLAGLSFSGKECACVFEVPVCSLHVLMPENYLVLF